MTRNDGSWDIRGISANLFTRKSSFNVEEEPNKGKSKICRERASNALPKVSERNLFTVNRLNETRRT